MGVCARRWQRGQPHREHQGACTAALLADLAGCGRELPKCGACGAACQQWGSGLAECYHEEKATQAVKQCGLSAVEQV